MTYDAFTPAPAQDSAHGAASANTVTGANSWLGTSGGSNGTANSGGYGGQRGSGGRSGMPGNGNGAAVGAMPAGASPAGISPRAAGVAANQNPNQNSSLNSGPNSGQNPTQNAAQNPTQNGNDSTGQELLNRQIEQHMRQHEAARHEQWQKQVSQWREEVAQDPQLGGVHMAANVARAQLALDRFDQGRHIGKLLEESGYGNHPEVLRFFNRVADALMEDSLVRGEPGGGMPPLEERMYAGWSSRK